MAAVRKRKIIHFNFTLNENEGEILEVHTIIYAAQN